MKRYVHDVKETSKIRRGRGFGGGEIVGRVCLCNAKAGGFFELEDGAVSISGSSIYGNLVIAISFGLKELDNIRILVRVGHEERK